MDKLQILESVLGSGGKTNRDYYQFHCPFCSHRKKKLGISLGTGKWKCWVCPSKGPNVSILFRKLNQPQSKVQQVKDLWKEKVYFKTEPSSNLQLPKEFKPLWDPSGSFFYKKAQGYVKKRGITEGDIIKHHIGYCEHGQYNDKVIFPSYTEQGQLNFFGSRTFNELSNYKFKIPENIDKNEIVFDENLINWQEPVILVESKLDAIVIKRNAYPLYGKGINKALQQKVLEEGTNEIIFCLDGDALNDAILQAEWFLNNGITVKKVQLPENEDPNSLGYKEVWKYIKQAEPLNENEIWLFKIKNKLK